MRADTPQDTEICLGVLTIVDLWPYEANILENFNVSLFDLNTTR